MIAPPVLIKSIHQQDNHTFAIEWNDGKIHQYRLSLLQRHCPCAKCYDIEQQKSRLQENSVDDDVRATQLQSVGRYALRISFTSGCSAGIYHYELLRSLGEHLIS